MIPFAHRRRLQLIIILLLTTLAYSNIFQNEFVWDDPGFILNWPEIRNFQHLPSLLQGDLPTPHGGVYRPLRSLFYLFSYYLFGTSPLGYHFQSLLIHLLCTFLVYFITLRLTSSISSSPHPSLFAFITTLLFGLHPLHTEAITFITTSFDILGILFFLASFLLYLRYQDPVSPPKRKKRDFLFSLFFAALAFFTYELTLTLPLLIFFHDLCFKKITKKNWKTKIQTYFPYFLLFFLYLAFPFLIFPITSRGIYFIDQFYFKTLFITLTAGFLKYISLLFFPFPLSTHHFLLPGISSWKIEIPVQVARNFSLLHPKIIISALVICSLLFLIFFNLRKRPLLSFSLGWFFLTLLPVSNLFPFQNLISEKFAYLPSFGYCLLLSYFFLFFSAKRYKDKKTSSIIKTALLIIFLATLIFYSALTFERNQHWQDNFTLWHQAVSQNPRSSLAQENLGAAYFLQGNYSLALFHFKKAVQLGSADQKIFNNLGAAYLRLKRPKLAESYFKKAIASDPSHAQSYYNLAIVYKITRQYNLSLYYLNQTLELDPSHQSAQKNYLLLSQK